MAFLFPTEPTPVTSKVIVSFPITTVKDAVRSLLRSYPKFFITKKNGINDELGTYIFDRPKGIDTPTIRITLQKVNENQTCIELHSSSRSMTSTAPDLQLSITEVQNILMAKLSGKSRNDILKIIKRNNSGNGVWGCIKSLGCLIVFGFLLLCILGAFLSVLSNL